MSSRSAAKKLSKPAPRPSAKASRPAAKGRKPLAKITKFPKLGKQRGKPKRPASRGKGHGPAKKAPPAKKNFVMPPPAPAKPLQEQKQSLARSFYWSELRVGDDLPHLTKPAIDRVQIARYAAASADFNRLHLDEPFAHSLGFPALFAPGMLAMGFVGQLLSAWLRRGHIRRFTARFVKIVWPGDELTCRGRIGDLRKENGACYADVEVWAENQKGELVVRGQATCELYESPSAGAEGGGLLFALENAQPAGAADPKGLSPAKPGPNRPQGREHKAPPKKT